MYKHTIFIPHRLMHISTQFVNLASMLVEKTERPIRNGNKQQNVNILLTRTRSMPNLMILKLYKDIQSGSKTRNTNIYSTTWRKSRLRTVPLPSLPYTDGKGHLMAMFTPFGMDSTKLSIPKRTSIFLTPPQMAIDWPIS